MIIESYGNYNKVNFPVGFAVGSVLSGDSVFEQTKNSMTWPAQSFPDG